MIQSVSQKNYFIQDILFRAFWLAVTFATLSLPLFGQEAIDYRGVWQTETPDRDTLVLIVKRNYLASYFWADNADRTVYQGSWSSDANSVTLHWKDGSTHRIKRSSVGYEITHLDNSDNILYVASTTKLPEEILGQWAMGPSKPEDQALDRNKDKGFFGTWRIGAESNPYHLVIEPDRSAATSWIYETSDNGGLRGSWAKQGSELHISWDTGHYGILKQNERSFTFRLIAPGSVIENAVSDEMTATRISKDLLPDEWRNLYTVERANQSGSVPFANRTDAISFYRGPWIVQYSKDSFERIEIGRFGGLKTSADTTLYGNWRMSGKDIFMNWDDGMRKILKSIGNGFLIYEYKPGRPIDGVPTRIFSTTPENTEKLDRYRENQKEVALKLLALATDAGATSKANDSVWGQTLIGWAWPFGKDDKDTSSTGPLLQNDPELLRNIDPWWWPFWSENPSVEATTNVDPSNQTTEVVTNSRPARKTKAARSSQKNWDWPF